MVMQFHANHVSTSVAVGGDYYQVMFEAEFESENDDSPYLLIQRQFEDLDDDFCYVELHDRNYCGHFHLRRVDLTAQSLTVELDHPINNRINVTFSVPAAEFAELSRVLKIINGEIEPEPD
jgi:hypothetical protein